MKRIMTCASANFYSCSLSVGDHNAVSFHRSLWNEQNSKNICNLCLLGLLSIEDIIIR
jgi:hypothetical protein